MNRIEEFWMNVKKVKDCWEWQGALDHGYGRFRYNGKYWLAHNFIFFYKYPKTDKSKFILHHCDNPKCVRPKHLYAGTQLENMRDRLKRGNNPNASKTHCKHGHKFTIKNTYRRPDKPHTRNCLICARKRQKANYKYTSVSQRRLNATP